jgi:hypothetical protein
LISAPLAWAAPASYRPPVRAGTITASALPEVSGMTAARTVGGGWWVLNDSGNPPNLHLIGRRGRLIATMPVPNAANVDWEDIAAARAPDGKRYLYIVDIGDNGRARDDLVV